MVGELITLPLRVTGRVARLWWRATEEALSLASGAAGYAIERMSQSAPRPSETGPRPRAAERPAAQSAPASPPPAAAPSPPSPPTERFPTAPASPPAAQEPRPAAPVQEPSHVSEEPELVESFADPGAEDGAGASLHIREPWDGYRQMNAREVTAKLSGASPAELAAVQLYESSNRGRQTILAAVARQLKSAQHQLSGANGSGTQP